MSTPPTDFKGLVDFFVGIINSKIILIFASAFIVTIWKIIDAWIIHADDEKKRAEGRVIALTAVVVMAIMGSIWGILKLLNQSIFG